MISELIFGTIRGYSISRFFYLAPCFRFLSDLHIWANIFRNIITNFKQICTVDIGHQKCGKWILTTASVQSVLRSLSIRMETPKGNFSNVTFYLFFLRDSVVAELLYKYKYNSCICKTVHLKVVCIFAYWFLRHQRASGMQL